MSYTLLIIDVQPEFKSAVTKTVKATCQEEIKKAMDEKAAIVFVEYFDCGRTMSALTKMTKGYNWVYTVIKNDDDGSAEVEEIIRYNRLPGRKMRVCGVNTDACVEETVTSLAGDNPSSRIEVVALGCYSQDGNLAHKDGLNHMAKCMNVRIV